MGILIVIVQLHNLSHNHFRFLLYSPSDLNLSENAQWPVLEILFYDYCHLLVLPYLITLSFLSSFGCNNIVLFRDYILFSVIFQYLIGIAPNKRPFSY